MGNGIALASVCASMGYPCVLVMPQSVSSTKQMMMRRLGAKVVLTEATEGMVGAVSQAQCCLLVPPKGYIFLPPLLGQSFFVFLHLTNICQKVPQMAFSADSQLGRKKNPAQLWSPKPLRLLSGESGQPPPALISNPAQGQRGLVLIRVG